MATSTDKLKCRLENDSICIDDSRGQGLKISIQRAVRVRDSKDCISEPPPTPEAFPLFNVNQYALPKDIVRKGGIFSAIRRQYCLDPNLSYNLDFDMS
jgi:hypothetical protein